MTMTQRSTVVGVFHSRDRARDAIESLKDAGFAPDTISILTPDQGDTQAMADETGTQAGASAATGAVAGGVLGGLGGFLLGIGALAIPGIGPFIAAGAFASALGGAAIGAGVGAIAGALAGMGVPSDEAEYYEAEVKGGRTLVAVGAQGRYQEARDILRGHGAYDVETPDSASAAIPAAPTPAAGTAPPVASIADTGPGESRARSMTGRETLELREEELRVHKQMVEAGEVQITTEVVSQERTVQVPTMREEVTVERRTVERRPADRPIGEQEIIAVPFRHEEVTLVKRPVVYERIRVGTRAVQETRHVSGTVRREELVVEREGDARVVEGVGGDSARAGEVAESARDTR